MLLTISGNRVLDVSIDGSGLPTIILPKNISHLRGRSATGRSGATSGTFFVYEAAGSGASEPGPLPRTTSRIVADLEQLLVSGGLYPPYIVAGYSATGFEALLFAYRNKQHTRGLILIDPSIPFMDQNLYRISPMLHKREEGERRRLADLLSELKKTALLSDPTQIERLAKLECQLSEWDNLHTDSSEEIAAILKEPQALDSMPILVLSAGKFDVEAFCRDEIRENWHSVHSAYANLSANGEHRILADCDHGSISHQSDLLASAMDEMILPHAPACLSN
jgi:pimeloyl-ACP methyl ester carboxylesterase